MLPNLVLSLNLGAGQQRATASTRVGGEYVQSHAWWRFGCEVRGVGELGMRGAGLRVADGAVVLVWRAREAEAVSALKISVGPHRPLGANAIY